MTISASAPETAAAPLSEASRLGNVFLEPSKTFNDVNRNPSWFVPFILATLIGVLFAVSVGQKVGWARLAQSAVEKNSKLSDRMEQMKPEDRARQMAIMESSFKGGFYATPVLGLLFMLALAGILMGLFNFVLGAEVSFKTATSVIAYSWLIGAIKSLLVVVSLMMPNFDPAGFNLDNPAATNLAALLDATTANKSIYVLASSLDIINIWLIIVLGIGFSCVSKVKRGTAWALLFGAYAVITLLHAGIVAF